MSNQANISKRCFRVRYSVRHLLLLTTLVAIVLFGYQRHRNLKQAREEYDRTVQGWQLLFNSSEEVVYASESLRKLESDSIWISDRTARREHIKRLTEFVSAAEGAIPVTMYGSRESLDRAVEFIENVKTLIQQHETALKSGT